MTDISSLDLLRQRGGLAATDAAGETVFAAIPIDGEWVTGLGRKSLDHVVAMILASDGLAGEREGVTIVPHLTRDDALAYAEEEGCTVALLAAGLA
jgi:hypothetical protein